MKNRVTRVLAGCVGAMALLAAAGGAQAGSDAERMAEIKEKGGCPGCDLRLAELRGLVLENGDFGRANLREVDLKEALLKDANFKGSDFRRTERE